MKPPWPLEPGETADVYQDETTLDTSRFYRQFSLNTCDVRALNSVFTYQNEYLGNRSVLLFYLLTLIAFFWDDCIV